MSETAETLHDPRGLIRESFRIEGIGVEGCRSIFLDWALGQPAGADVAAAAGALLAHHAPPPDHPMTALLIEAQTAATRQPKRTGAARRRRER